ncbi:MAG: trg [Marmoricola sp.]|nr:trg [Marmoricola sp.]
MTELDTAAANGSVNGTTAGRSRKVARVDDATRPAAVLDALATRVLVTDCDGTITYANAASLDGARALADWLELGSGAILGQPLDLFSPRLAVGQDLPYDIEVDLGPATLAFHVAGATDGDGAMVTWDDVTERRAQDRDVARVTSMMENSPTNMMFADREFVITYMNPASLETLGGLQEHLPVKASEVVGSSLDIFHKTPAYQRGILVDDANLPRRANISVGPETLDLLVSAIRDDQGEYIGAMATWEVITDRLRGEREVAEATADTTAVNNVLASLSSAASVDQAIQLALDTVRRDFGWAYGSYWKIDELDNTLKYVQESGDAGEEFRRVTLSASFAEGVGLSGRAWKSRDLFFTQDIGEMTDCVRAPVAQTVGVKSGVCFPIIVAGGVIGTMDFFATETLHPSDQRLESLRNVGRLVSQAVERLDKETATREAAAELASKVDLVLEVVRAAGQGDLTREIPVDGDDAIGQLAAGLGSLLETLRASMTNIGTTADTLALASEQLTILSQGMGDGATATSDRAASASGASVQVSASIQTVATAAEEMTASIREIAKNATEAATVATGAVGVASSAQGTVASLGESSAEIGQVIKVITSIAQQTNLLALNATIEAARAGDAGKGFAVVANEVKELAKETARATEDIGQKIEAIQSDTQGAVAAIAEISEVIGRINDIQTTIASAVEEQTATTNEIARSVTEAAAGANGIAEDVTQVASAAEDTRQGAQNTLQSATDLAGMAAELKGLVGKFTV